MRGDEARFKLRGPDVPEVPEVRWGIDVRGAAIADAESPFGPGRPSGGG